MRDRRKHGFTRRTWTNAQVLPEQRLGKGRRWYDMAWSPADGVAQWTPHLVPTGGEDVPQVQCETQQEQVEVS